MAGLIFMSPMTRPPALSIKTVKTENLKILPFWQEWLSVLMESHRPAWAFLPEIMTTPVVSTLSKQILPAIRILSIAILGMATLRMQRSGQGWARIQNILAGDAVFSIWIMMAG